MTKRLYPKESKLVCTICSVPFLTKSKWGVRGKLKTCSRHCSMVLANKNKDKESSGRAISMSRLGSKNPMWKGDSVGYMALHGWVKRRLLKPKLCASCKGKAPHDLANISQHYKREVTDWEWLCRKCHMEKDGRLAALKTGSQARAFKNISCIVCSKSFHPRRKTTRFCSKSCARTWLNLNFRIYEKK